MEGAEKKKKVVFVVGPTASGKSDAAMALAREFNGEIINADSMQLYRHMDIGTAKPPLSDRKEIPHHLIDLACPDEEYTAARFRDDAVHVINDIYNRGRLPIVAGGTGLYIKVLIHGIFKGPGRDDALREELLKIEREQGAGALHERLKEIDPTAAHNIHPTNVLRAIRALEVYHITGRPISKLQAEHAFSEKEFDTLKLGMRLDRNILYRRINERAERMIKAGLEAEARRLLSMEYTQDLKPMQGLGYKEMVAYINGAHTKSETEALIMQRTRNYAKRQLTWFNKDAEIEWFAPDDGEAMKERVLRFLHEEAR